MKFKTAPIPDDEMYLVTYNTLLSPEVRSVYFHSKYEAGKFYKERKYMNDNPKLWKWMGKWVEM